MFFFAKIHNGRQMPYKIVTYEVFNIYSFVIPLSRQFFPEELISGVLFKF